MPRRWILAVGVTVLLLSLFLFFFLQEKETPVSSVVVKEIPRPEGPQTDEELQELRRQLRELGYLE